MISYRFILTLAFFLVISCRIKKDISSQSRNYDLIETSDTTVKKYERINADWIRINESILRRDGLVTIRFDSLASILVMPDQSIQAVGYNPVIESSSSDLKKLNIRDSLQIEKSDSLIVTGSKKKEESESEESSNIKVNRTPSLTPWIGAGLAIAIVVLAVLYYFFRRR